MFYKVDYMATPCTCIYSPRQKGLYLCKHEKKKIDSDVVICPPPPPKSMVTPLLTLNVKNLQNHIV